MSVLSDAVMVGALRADLAAANAKVKSLVEVLRVVDKDRRGEHRECPICCSIGECDSRCRLAKAIARRQP
jgi:hypothetical protein